MTDNKPKQERQRKYLKHALTLIAIASAIGIVFSFTSAGFASPIGDQQYDETFTIDNNYTKNMEIGLADGIMHTNYSTEEVRVEMTEKEGTQVISYHGNNADITLYDDKNTTIEVVETPHGRLETGYEKGEIIDKFRGHNKTAVKNQEEKLKEELDRIMRAIETQREIVRKDSLPDIKLEINKENDEDTYFEITNNEDEEISLEGWVMEGLESETSTREAEHTFQDIEITSGETLKVYTETDNQIEDDEHYTVADEMTIYSSSSDTIQIYNHMATKILEKSYNQ